MWTLAAIGAAAILAGSAKAQLFTAPAPTGTATMSSSMTKGTGFGKKQAQPTSRAEREAAMVVEMTRSMLSRVNGLSQTKVDFSVQSQITQAAPFPSPLSGANVAYSQDECVYHIREAEKRYNLPPYLLHAIALTESGKGGKPHPHAMNIMGKSYFGKSTGDMESVVNRYGAGSSIDVGCMQINLKYHAKRFRDWRSLLMPQYNAEYGALYLTELYREFGSWTKAVAAYHSRTSWKGANYVCLVTRRYGQIFGSNRPGCGPNIEDMVRLMYSSIGNRAG